MQEWINYFQILRDIVSKKGIESYIVGGALRDLFLGRRFIDIDITVKQRVPDLARYFADKIKGSFVILDQQRNIYRVVKNSLYFDFTLMSGKNIEEDLVRRDFSINAIAYPIFLKGTDFPAIESLLKTCFRQKNWLGEKSNNRENGKGPIKQVVDDRLMNYFIDPSGGIKDLKKTRIKATHEEIFSEDPLRLWRAMRLKGQLGFEIEEETIKMMKKSRELAAIPARERIREEFVKILKTRNTSELISYLEKEFEMLSALIPDIAKMKATGENKHHQEDAWTHSLLVLEALEAIISDDTYNKHLDTEKIYLLKLSSILHDIGKIASRSIRGENIHYFGHEKVGAEMASAILKGLKYSREEVNFVRDMVRYHMRPMLLYIAENLTDKGRHRFFKQVGPLTPQVLIHSLADKTAAMKVNQREDEIVEYISFINNMLDMYYEYRSRTEELLLTGKELIDLLNITEGPEIGSLLNKLKEAQGRGLVRNREEALNFLKGISD